MELYSLKARSIFCSQYSISGSIVSININVMRLEVADNLTMLFGKAGEIVVVAY